MKSLRCCVLACVALGLCLSVVGYAMPVTDLFSSTVKVKDQSIQQRREAVYEGWCQVLVKVSGQRVLLDRPAVKSGVSLSESMLQQFHYQSSTRDAHSVFLKMSFNAERISAFLAQLNTPVWRADRRRVLVLISDPNHHLGSDYMTDQAMIRGMPLIVPVLPASAQSDFEQRTLATIDAPWIREHLGHYPADVFIVGQVLASGGTWQVNGVVLDEGRLSRWVIVGARSVKLLYTRLVDQIADRLALSDISEEDRGEASVMQLKVRGVHTLIDYQSVLQAIRGVVAIADVKVQRLEGDQLQLALNVVGGRLSLLKGMAQLHAFVLDFSQLITPKAPLTYYWRTQDVSEVN